MRAVSRSPPGLGAGFRARLGAARARRRSPRRCCRPGIRVIPLAEAATLGETLSAMLRSTFGFALAHHAAGARGAVRELRQRHHHHGDRAARARLRRCSRSCFTGASLNVYSQIGLVLLVGVMAKNGILIVEFANQLRDRGAACARRSSRLPIIRLRPVMMTMICTVLGGVPLVLAGRRRRRGAHRARLGHRRRARPGDRLDAVPDAGRLSAARPLLQDALRRSRPPRRRAWRDGERRCPRSRQAAPGRGGVGRGCSAPSTLCARLGVRPRFLARHSRRRRN